MIANSCRLFNNTEEKIMKLKEFINKAVSVAMCAMIIGTTVVSVNVKADTKSINGSCGCIRYAYR